MTLGVVSMSTRFVGRDGELNTLAAGFGRLATSRGPVVAVILGEPGIGKSRLLAEATARLPGRRRVELAGFEPERGVALASARNLLRVLDVWAAPSVAGPSPRAAAGLVGLFEAAYQQLIPITPLLVVVDDMQWIDENSAALIHYLIRAAEDSSLPLGLLAATRPTSKSKVLVESLTKAIRDPSRFAVTELGPLPARDARALAGALAPEATDSQISEWCALAEGSPFWLEALAGGHAADREADQLVTARVAGLDRDDRALFTYLAVLGRPLPIPGGAGLLRWGEQRLETAVRELETLGLIRDAGTAVQASHDLLRRAALQLAPAESITAVHQACAAWLEDQAGADLHTLLEALEHRHAAMLPVEDLALRIAQAPHRHLLGTQGFNRLLSLTSPNDSDSLSRSLGTLAAELGEHETALDLWSGQALKDGEGAADASLAALALLSICSVRPRRGPFSSEPKRSRALTKFWRYGFKPSVLVCSESPTMTRKRATRRLERQSPQGILSSRASPQMGTPSARHTSKPSLQPLSRCLGSTVRVNCWICAPNSLRRAPPGTLGFTPGP